MVVFFSGKRRGRTLPLLGDVLHLGTAPDNELQVMGDPTSKVAAHHATLRRQGDTYELRVAPQGEIWVNGEAVESRILEPGDLIEVGKGGPVMRYRTYASGRPVYRSPTEVLSDCYRGAALAAGPSPSHPKWHFVTGLPRYLFADTSRLFRGVTLIVALLALGTLAYSLQLGHRLESETMRIGGISDLVEDSKERSRLTSEELTALRDEIDRELTAAAGRIESLEARSAASAQVIAQAAPSIVFVQGAFGFRHPPSGRWLRFAVGPEGGPVPGAANEPAVTLDGDGPVVQSVFTGTAFVVSDGGLLLTNRHVAEPWKYDRSAQAVAQQGLEPAMYRFLGYFSGVEEPVEVKPVRVSETVDLAILGCSLPAAVSPLALRETMPQPGEEVIVMGYPTGIRALLARVDDNLANELMADRSLNFWSVARRLSELGHIAPLATRGIVGQVTSAAVVYDAETTGGGSGGPVLGLDGCVVAVNTAILTEFGGSNLGVPAVEARRLLDETPPPVEDRPPADPEALQPVESPASTK